MDKNWQVFYYISASGDNPVKDFLDERPSAKLKVFKIFNTLLLKRLIKLRLRRLKLLYQEFPVLTNDILKDIIKL